MSDYHSNEYYHLLEIPGKGFGAIAKKDIKIGTLILKEKPQILDNGSLIPELLLKLKKSKNPNQGRLSIQCQEWLEKGIPDWIKSVMASYNQMTKVDQDEFLKLKNNVHSHLGHWYGQSFLRTAMFPETLQTVIGQTFQVKYILEIWVLNRFVAFELYSLMP